MIKAYVNTNMSPAEIHYSKRDILSFASLLFITITFMLFTNPQQLSVQLLLVLPVLIGCTSYYFVKLMAGLFSDMDYERRKRLSFVIATGPTIMVVLGSLHQLGAQDIALATAFTLGLGWYLKRTQSIGLN